MLRQEQERVLLQHGLPTFIAQDNHIQEGPSRVTRIATAWTTYFYLPQNNQMPVQSDQIAFSEDDRFQAARCHKEQGLILLQHGLILLKLGGDDICCFPSIKMHERG